ncbi:MAG: hypothetical protein HQM14_19245 [SAR324 cluster bacterium]|nr:hypothetical protein [SAR324 cluster bacterium]
MTDITAAGENNQIPVLNKFEKQKTFSDLSNVKDDFRAVILEQYKHITQKVVNHQPSLEILQLSDNSKEMLSSWLEKNKISLLDNKLICFDILRQILSFNEKTQNLVILEFEKIKRKEIEKKEQKRFVEIIKLTKQADPRIRPVILNACLEFLTRIYKKLYNRSLQTSSSDQGGSYEALHNLVVQKLSTDLKTEEINTFETIYRNVFRLPLIVRYGILEFMYSKYTMEYSNAGNPGSPYTSNENRQHEYLRGAIDEQLSVKQQLERKKQLQADKLKKIQEKLRPKAANDPYLDLKREIQKLKIIPYVEMMIKNNSLLKKIVSYACDIHQEHYHTLLQALDTLLTNNQKVVNLSMEEQNCIKSIYKRDGSSPKTDFSQFIDLLNKVGKERPELFRGFLKNQIQIDRNLIKMGVCQVPYNDEEGNEYFAFKKVERV